MKSEHITKTRPNHKFPSLKNRRTIAARNFLTLHYCYHLEYDAMVVSYCETANKILYEVNGYYTPFIPHFIVHHKEAPPKAVYLDQGGTLTDSTLSKIATVYRRKNMDFCRITAAEINSAPLLPNLHLLFRYARQIPTHADQLAVFEFFKTRRAAELGDLGVFFHSKGLNPTMPYSLIFHHQLTTELNKPLGVNSIVRP